MDYIDITFFQSKRTLTDLRNIPHMLTFIQRLYIQHFYNHKPFIHCWHSCQGKIGVWYLAQGHSGMLSGGARDRSTDPLLGG